MQKQMPRIIDWDKYLCFALASVTAFVKVCPKVVIICIKVGSFGRRAVTTFHKVP